MRISSGAILLFLILLSPSLWGEAILYLGGRPADLQEYYIKAVKEILASSEYSAGFRIYREEIVSARVEILIADNEFLHMTISTTPELQATDNRLMRIPAPIHRGILGLRQLIVLKDKLEQFSPVLDIVDFKKLIVGQGSRWTDTQIYKHAGIHVHESFQFSLLFDLLEKKRIDYLPLGLVEAEQALKRQERDELQIAPDIYILYAIPTYLLVSENNPGLIEAIQKGIKETEKNGKLDSIFAKHFQHQLANIRAEKATVVVLENPVLSPQDNTKIQQEVMKRFFNSSTRIIRAN